jgi:hypothetical protein
MDTPNDQVQPPTDQSGGPEIAEVLRIRDSEGPPCGYVTELLTGHLERVERRIAELIALCDELRLRIPPAAPDPDRCQPDQVCYLIKGAS